MGRKEKTRATSYRYGTVYMMIRGPKNPAYDEANTMDLLLNTRIRRSKKYEIKGCDCAVCGLRL